MATPIAPPPQMTMRLAGLMLPLCHTIVPTAPYAFGRMFIRRRTSSIGSSIQAQ